MLQGDCNVTIVAGTEDDLLGSWTNSISIPLSDGSLSHCPLKRNQICKIITVWKTWKQTSSCSVSTICFSSSILISRWWCSIQMLVNGSNWVWKIPWFKYISGNISESLSEWMLLELTDRSGYRFNGHYIHKNILQIHFRVEKKSISQVFCRKALCHLQDHTQPANTSSKPSIHHCGLFVINKFDPWQVLLCNTNVPHYFLYKSPLNPVEHFFQHQQSTKWLAV